MSFAAPQSAPRELPQELAKIKAESDVYAAKGGLGDFLADARKYEISDFLVLCGPDRIRVTRHGRFYTLPAESFPHAEAWKDHLQTHYMAPGPLKDRFEQKKTIDFAVQLPGGGIARAHVWSYRGINASFRIQPEKPPSLGEIFQTGSEREKRIIEDLRDIFSRRQGLVVIGGEVRSGKTWLENALYDDLNRNTAGKQAYIVGDPPEFEHEEVGMGFITIDVSERGTTQADEIISALRVPKNIFSPGEMRGDPKSTEAALQASLSGSLVVTTGHFPNIGNIISRFSIGSEEMSEASKRAILVEALQGVVLLSLYPGLNGREVLAVSYIDFKKHSNLRNDIREGREIGTQQISPGLRPMSADLQEILPLLAQDVQKELRAVA